MEAAIGWEEYLVFGATLLLSVGIGIYYGFFNKQNTTKEYLLANRSMSAFPVSLSLVCSAVSAITLIANPVEIYLYGTQYMLIILCYIPFTFSLAYLYIPVYFSLNVNSAYEYIEKRFSSRVRLVVSVLAVIHLIVSMAIAVYAPSLAINQVTGIDTKLSTAAIYFVCIFYSSLGGLKAVLWTDVLQAFIMLGSLLAIVIKGVSDMGGFSAVWKKAEEGGRIGFLNFDADTRTRHTIWTDVVAGYFFWIPTYAATQIQIQRFLSMPNLATARRALIYNAIGLTVIVTLCCYTGLVLFARYADCDPIANNEVTKTDQLLPLFVSEIAQNLPGLMGVFIAGITCASMSTLSSGLSALTSITTYDYINKIFPTLSDAKLSRLSKINCFALGMISYAFVFVVENMGNILPATSSILGIFMGPILGLFSLGMFFPSANTKGALSGMLLTFLLMIVFTIGNQIASNKSLLPDQRLPLSTAGCVAPNSTLAPNVTSTTEMWTTSSWEPSTTERHHWKDDGDSFLIQFLSISYLWYSALGCVSGVFFSLIFSTIFNFTDGVTPVDSKYISPPVLFLWTRFFPHLSRTWLKTTDNSNSRDSTISLSQNPPHLKGKDHIIINNNDQYGSKPAEQEKESFDKL